MICFNASFSGSKMQTFFFNTHIKIHQEKQLNLLCADPEGGRGSDPLENHKNIGFLSNTGPDP